MSNYVHKRGDTFELGVHLSAVINGVTITDFTGYTLVSKVRDPKGGLIANLVCTWIDAATGHALITAPSSTATWPLTVASMDVKLVTPDLKTITSDVVNFEIEESISRD